MTKKRPFGVTLLALLAGLAFIVALIHTLQMLHLLPIRGPFGEAHFFAFDALGLGVFGGFGAADEDELSIAAVFGVELCNRVGGGSRTREEIHDNVVGLCGDAENMVHQLKRLRC